MRPYQVLLFIIACLGLLAALCIVLPHEVSVGERTLRWPTLAEVLDVKVDSLELRVERSRLVESGE